MRRFIFIVSILISLVDISKGKESESLSLKTLGQENVPFKFDHQNPKLPGFCQELIDILNKDHFSISGSEKLTSIRRIESELERGAIDLSICLLKNTAREKKFHFIPIPLFVVNHIVVSIKSKALKISSFDDLREISKKDPLLVSQGSSLVKTLEAQKINYDDSPKGDISVIKMLEKNRGRFAYMQDMSLFALVRNRVIQNKDLKIYSSLQKDTQYVATSKHLAPQKIELLTQKLKSLQAEGTFEKIKKKYSNP